MYFMQMWTEQNFIFRFCSHIRAIILRKNIRVISVLEEHSKQQCRDTIKDIYYRYYEKKKIPLYERKTADKTYDLYVHKFNGNSYVELLYSEIIKWEIDTSYLDIEKDDE